MNNILQINNVKDFKKYVINNNKIIVIYFYNDNHLFSEKNDEILSILNENCNGNLSTIKININKIPEICRITNLTTIPIIKIYKNGSCLHDIYITLPNFIDIIKSIIK